LRKDYVYHTYFTFFKIKNEALALLGLDMDLWNEGSTILDTMKVPERSCHLSLKFNQNKFNASRQCVRILFKKEFIINGK